jgi:hypothetical protein
MAAFANHSDLREQKKERYEAIEATMDKGCVVRLTDLSEDCSREDLKACSLFADLV